MSRFNKHEIARLGWIVVGFAALWLGAALLTLLPSQLNNFPLYQLVHINATRISVILDALIFSLAWNAFDSARRSTTVFLALAFLSAGCYDFLYLVRLPGMPTFLPQPNADDALYFWLLARLVTGLGLLAATLLPDRQAFTRRDCMLALLGAIICILGVAGVILCAWSGLPDLSSNGVRLKAASSLLTLGLSTLAGILVWRRQPQAADCANPAGLDRVDLFCAVLALLISEVHFNFLLYENALNLLGPLFKLLSLVFVYRAVLGAGIKAPYATLSEMTCRLQQTSAALRASEVRLAGIIQNATDAIVTTDEDGSIILANPAAAAMFGTTVLQMHGSLFEFFIPQRHRKGFLGYIHNFTRVRFTYCKIGSSDADYDVAGLRANGEEFPLEASISVMVEGQSRFTILILRDITERKHAQQALARSHEELSRLSTALQSVREEERKHIARDLHDDLGQLLAALRIDLSLLQQQAIEASVRPGQLQNMDALLSTSITSLRRIASDLRPRALDEGGLYFALQSLCKEFAARHDIECELIAEEDELILDEPRTTALFRIVQEALANVFRHAHASAVLVLLQRQSDRLQLRIEDDGCGIREDDFHKALTVGLVDMRERVKAMGGELVIGSRPDAGTHIDIAIPV